MTTCHFCEDPLGNPPGSITIEGKTFLLCPSCDNWGYLRGAENMTGVRLDGRISGVYNVLRTNKRMAAEKTAG
jgi:hypothetical protein